MDQMVTMEIQDQLGQKETGVTLEDLDLTETKEKVVARDYLEPLEMLEIKELEDQLLYKLANAEGDILEVHRVSYTHHTRTRLLIWCVFIAY